jgi:hypothetical protein
VSLSVRVVRVHELPDGQRIVVDPDPQGTTTVYMLEEDIGDEAALCLSDALTCVKQSIFYPLFLAMTGALHAAPIN